MPLQSHFKGCTGKINPTCSLEYLLETTYYLVHVGKTIGSKEKFARSIHAEIYSYIRRKINFADLGN